MPNEKTKAAATKDTVKPKPAETPQQKRAKLDSIAKVRREEIVAKKDSIMRRNAAASGQDLDTYKKEARKANKASASAGTATNSMSRDGKKVKPVKTGCRY
jgi:hypothetical protein